MNKKSYLQYLWKTVKWLVGNTIFGLFPLIFLASVYVCSDGKICKDGVDTLIYEGTVLFVCLAIVGSVLVDYWLSGIHTNGFARFATYAFPVIIVFYVSINFLLIHMNVIPHERFSLTGGMTIVTIFLSCAYILFMKTNLYIKEDIKNA